MIRVLQGAERTGPVMVCDYCEDRILDAKLAAVLHDVIAVEASAIAWTAAERTILVHPRGRGGAFAAIWSSRKVRRIETREDIVSAYQCATC